MARAQDLPGTGTLRRFTSQEVNGYFYEAAEALGIGNNRTTALSNELDVDDVDGVRLYLEYTSDADDDDEVIIAYVQTSPDGTNWETEETKVSFRIIQSVSG
jgi:hypothetical protein